MGGAVSAGEDNEELVDNLVESEYVKTPSVEKALRAVDRGNYYLEGARHTAYKDLAWKHGNLHLSAPCIYSEVLECLQISKGMFFLNLGSGTGYLSTVVGLLLGGSGVNHGVEVFQSVVDYAKDRLEEFIEHCPAIDLMDFTSPDFVVGNCLQLDPSTCLGSYDRVYCGAAVPDEHQSFVRSLVKVNGVIVMPNGDQLQKITRTGMNTYEVKSVLPVSFATLIVPTAEQLARGNIVMLPEKKPQTLQNICRSKVRECLRELVTLELPDTQLKSLVQERGGCSDQKREDARESRGRQNNRHRYRVRRIVIPVLQSDSDEDDHAELRERTLRRHIVAIRTTGASRNAEGRIQIEDFRWNRQLVPEEEAALDRTQNESDASDAEEVTGETQKGMLAAVEEALGERPPAEEHCSAQEESCSDKAEELTSAPAQMDATPGSSSEENEPADKTERRCSSSEATDSDEDECRPSSRKRKVGAAPGSGLEAKASSDSDAADSCDQNKEQRRQARELVCAKQKMFSDRMKLKVSQLPLPAKLRDFLNYHRQR